MKNILRGKIYLLCALMFTFACVELDQIDPNSRTESGFWTNEIELEQGLMAAYDQLQDGLYNQDLIIQTFVISDEGTQEWPFELRASATFTIGNLNSGLPLWTYLYGLIGRSYQVIDRAPSILGTKVNRINGEAKFLAALAYYNLVGFFGERIAYVDQIQEATDRPRRAESGEIWELCEILLTEAIADLPLQGDISSGEYGRASKGAAQALLAKIHLQQNEFAEAEPLLRAIIDSDQYALNENFEDNFIEQNSVNPESVFQINFLHDGILGERDESRFFRFNSVTESNGVFGDIQVTNYVVESFNSETDKDGNRDPRMDASVFWSGSNRLFYGLSHDAWLAAGTPANEDIVNSLYKYSEQDAVATNDPSNFVVDEADGGTDFIVIRYADVLLLYSEVLNQLGTGDKYEHVDMVRERANMVPLSISKPGLNQQDFLTQIKHERIVELMGEGVRHYDLIRWGDFNKNSEVNDPNFKTFTSGQDEVWPIPQVELDLNLFLVQNPGY